MQFVSHTYSPIGDRQNQPTTTTTTTIRKRANMTFNLANCFGIHSSERKHWIDQPKSNFRYEFPQVFDYDWGLQDDFMGSAKIDLTQLELGKAEDINLSLSDTNNGEPGLSMGEILINLTLWPRSQEDKEMVSQTTRRFGSSLSAAITTHSTQTGFATVATFPFHANPIYITRSSPLSRYPSRYLSYLYPYQCLVCNLWQLALVEFAD